MGEVLLAILMVPGVMVVLLGLELLERRLLGPAPPATGESPTRSGSAPRWGSGRRGSPPRQTVAQPDGGREPGVLAGRYRLGEIIGLGGAATVYRGWERHTGRAVAVKLCQAEAVSCEPPPHRAEVAALAVLRHPGLVQLYDAGVEAGCCYLVMQLVEGETLARRIRTGPLPGTAVAVLGAALADALTAVHERGIIHRDLKPANVLLDGEDRPYLADFGVARLMAATHSTATDVVLGTPAFLAPEQVTGHPVGPAADVYALGLVLLEALTGYREYPGGAVESAVARLHRPPRLPEQLPAELRELLREMTDPDPASRPVAAHVAARLHKIGPTQLAIAPPEPSKCDTTVVDGCSRRCCHDGEGRVGSVLSPGDAMPVNPRPDLRDTRTLRAVGDHEIAQDGRD